jgi:hypothetical protein
LLTALSFESPCIFLSSLLDRLYLGGLLRILGSKPFPAFGLCSAAHFLTTRFFLLLSSSLAFQLTPLLLLAARLSFFLLPLSLIRKLNFALRLAGD